jgi:hypothetical protein
MANHNVGQRIELNQSNPESGSWSLKQHRFSGAAGQTPQGGNCFLRQRFFGNRPETVDLFKHDSLSSKVFAADDRSVDQRNRQNRASLNSTKPCQPLQSLATMIGFLEDALVSCSALGENEQGNLERWCSISSVLSKIAKTLAAN